MRILQVNTVYKRGSTGKIIVGIEEQCDLASIEHYAAYRYRESGTDSSDHAIEVSTWLDCHVHNRISTWTGLQGCFSAFRTMRFLRKVKKVKPDLIHLHNIHGSYVNHAVLFRYLKKSGIPVIWTLHDCWSFTGLCPYFTEIACYKWKESCGSCEVCRANGMRVDFTKQMLQRKKRLFSDIPKMTVVTPSEWLKGLAEESFLKQYPIKVINNGIDVDIFKPQGASFKREKGIEDKFMILGVAFDWGHRKGLDVFIALAGMLPEEYQIVLVGTNDDMDKELPANIISIHRTNNQMELAQIYSAADLFLNPTREDNYPTVNLEAIACGTPVLTFDTGGSAEMIDESCGAVVADDLDAICRKIHEIRSQKPFDKERILAKAKEFDQKTRFQEYVDLYLQSASGESTG